MPAQIARLVIAGTHSGVGKTTLTAGLTAALTRRGLAVQPFKVGPDYIDPSYHTLASGRPCRNLDTWMVQPERVTALFAQVAQASDISIIEGVMGIYDGADYEDDRQDQRRRRHASACPPRRRAGSPSNRRCRSRPKQPRRQAKAGAGSESCPPGGGRSRCQRKEPQPPLQAGAFPNASD